MSIAYHQYDLPDNIKLSGDIAVDTEAMGLNNLRDRLCVVQIADANGQVHIVHFPSANYDCPNLKKTLAQTGVTKIFHFGRFDIAIMQYYLDISIDNIYCTKIASKLCRTYTNAHGLKDLCLELLGVKITKQQQTSDWGAKELTQDQLEYAANDVIYLHEIREHLDEKLKREGRFKIAKHCFNFLPYRAKLDLLGWQDSDIFAHSS
jgi:ribonuclease D